MHFIVPEWIYAESSTFSRFHSTAIVKIKEGETAMKTVALYHQGQRKYGTICKDIHRPFFKSENVFTQDFTVHLYALQNTVKFL